MVLPWKTGHRQCGFTLQSHLEWAITWFAIRSWRQDPQVRGFLQYSGFCGTKSLIMNGMPAGDCFWQCFLLHLTWAVLNSSPSCTFINYICELFIDSSPVPLFFFLLKADDVFLINYLVGIVWHKREYFTNYYISLFLCGFSPCSLVISPQLISWMMKLTTNGLPLVCSHRCATFQTLCSG